MKLTEEEIKLYMAGILALDWKNIRRLVWLKLTNPNRCKRMKIKIIDWGMR